MRRAAAGWWRKPPEGISPPLGGGRKSKNIISIGFLSVGCEEEFAADDFAKK